MRKRRSPPSQFTRKRPLPRLRHRRRLRRRLPRLWPRSQKLRLHRCRPLLRRNRLGHGSAIRLDLFSCRRSRERRVPGRRRSSKVGVRVSRRNSRSSGRVERSFSRGRSLASSSSAGETQGFSSGRVDISSAGDRSRVGGRVLAGSSSVGEILDFSSGRSRVDSVRARRRLRPGQRGRCWARMRRGLP